MNRCLASFVNCVFMCPQAAKLSASSGTPLRPALLSQHLSPSMVQCNNARAAFQLLQSLGSENPPQDDLHIMVSIPLYCNVTTA